MAQVFVPPVETDRFPPPGPDERLWPDAAWPVESPISTQAPPPTGEPASLAPAAVGAPPGWYPEPPRERFWDGASWTDETRPTGPTAPVAAPVAASLAVAPAPVTMAAAPPAAPPVRAPVAPPAAPPVGAPIAPPLGAPVTTAPAPVALVRPEPAPAPLAPVGGSVAESRGLAHELVTLVLVLSLAIAAGALVAAIGIIVTV